MAVVAADLPTAAAAITRVAVVPEGPLTAAAVINALRDKRVFPSNGIQAVAAAALVRVAAIAGPIHVTHLVK